MRILLGITTFTISAVLLFNMVSCSSMNTLDLNAQLVPPKGYYKDPIESKASKKKCVDIPPHNKALQVQSKYKGSSSSRDRINKKADRAYKQQTLVIRRFEKQVVSGIDSYLLDGYEKSLDCAIETLNTWATANAMLSNDTTHTGASMRKWMLASVAGAYLRVKFSSKTDLNRYPQIESIETWFKKLSDKIINDDAGQYYAKKPNNHLYWAAWAVMAVAVIDNNHDYYHWSKQVLIEAIEDIDPNEGFLPRELHRSTRALAYHSYSLQPISLLLAFVKANGYTFSTDQKHRLTLLTDNVFEGFSGNDFFKRKTGSNQKLEITDNSKYSSLYVYCRTMECDSHALEKIESYKPFKMTRMGGAISEIF